MRPTRLHLLHELGHVAICLLDSGIDRCEIVAEADGLRVDSSLPRNESGAEIALLSSLGGVLAEHFAEGLRGRDPGDTAVALWRAGCLFDTEHCSIDDRRVGIAILKRPDGEQQLRIAAVAVARMIGAFPDSALGFLQGQIEAKGRTVIRARRSVSS